MVKSISSLKITEIADLADEFPFWRVRWFGELSINQIVHEPLIDLWLTPLRKNETFDYKDESLTLNERYDLSETRSVAIGVGQLPLVSVGSFFEKGRLIPRPLYETRVFTFKPDNENQKIIYHEGREKDALSVLDQVLDFIVPCKSKSLIVDFNRNIRLTNEFHDIGIRKTGGGFADEIHGLMIPCVELIRFYYANSSQMFHQIFTDGLVGEDNRVFKQSSSRMPDLHGKNGFVQLSKWVKNLDAPTVARLLFDSYALKQARNIYISLLNSSQKGEGRVPEAYFPFNNQETSLKVHGRYIDTAYGNYFLVYWIESCTAAFPFEEFKFWRDNPGWMANEYPGKDFEGNDSKFRYPDDYSSVDLTASRRRYSSSEIEINTSVAPSIARAELEILLPLNKFPDLIDKRWELENPSPENGTKNKKDNVKVNLYDVAEPIEIGSTAPRHGTKKVSKLSVVTIRQGDEVLNLSQDLTVKRIALFEGIIDIVNKSSEISCTPIYLPPNSAEVEYGNKPTRFPIIDFSEVEEKKSEIEKLQNQDVYIMQLVYLKGNKSLYGYFFEIIPNESAKESDKNSHCYCLLFKEGTFQPLKGSEIIKVLIECLKTGGTWFKTKHVVIEKDSKGNIINQKTTPYLKLESSVGDLKMIKIPHRDESSNYYAKTLIKKFKDAIPKIENFN